jgi:hypothetical protein
VPPQTCVFGTVKTAGDMVMVVQRARVLVSVSGSLVAKSWTDDEGRFAACFGSREIEDTVTLTVNVAKPPFTPTTQTRETHRGQHQVFEFHLEAEGLTH